MYLTDVALTNFRSYPAQTLTFAPGVVLLVGPNGYGKTNVVEAIEYLATLTSHRVAGDVPLIRVGEAAATVSARVTAARDDPRTLRVDVELRAGAANQARLNGAPVRPRAIVGAVRTVMFAPEDLAIVRGDPAERRRFLDEVVVARWPRLAGVKADYDKALRQKTALLKAMSGRSSRRAGSGAEATLELWNQQLARHGAEVTVARWRAAADLAGPLTAQYAAIAPTPAAAHAQYNPTALEGVDSAPDIETTAGRLAELMDIRRDDEIDRGVCLIGPHRDDLALTLGDMPVKGYASHGEGWSVVLALRLASLDVLRADGVEPVLILDDAFAELDEMRRDRLVQATSAVEQTFITAAVERDVPTSLGGQVFQVAPGVVDGPNPWGSA